jgi:hypothetical protein
LYDLEVNTVPAFVALPRYSAEVGQDRVTFTITNHAIGKSYEIYYSKNVGDGELMNASMLSSTSSVIVVDGLDLATYYFQIKGVGELSSITNVFSKTTTAIPLSNICFPPGTKVVTDEGVFNIEEIQGKKMGGYEVVLTKTWGVEDYVVEFKAGCFGMVPYSTVRMSGNHGILINGVMCKAKEVKEGVRVGYEGELYNVLLPVHGLMNVEGLACETLDPRNRVAKLYRQGLTEEKVMEWNEYVSKNQVYLREISV